MIRRGLVVLLALTTLGVAGCDKESSDVEKRLRAALENTERLSHRFTYTEVFKQEKSIRETTVLGLVEDDFRYKARVLLGKAPIIDEAVSDDAIAERFLEPAVLADFVRKPNKQKQGGTGVGSDPNAPEAPTPVARDDAGPDPVEALRSRRWVLDKAGAPAVFGGPETERTLGDDPILDSLDVFGYVERAINEASRIVEFNEDSLEYRKSEDPFPRPKKDSGIIRYDFIRPNLPKAADRSAGGNQVTPDTRSFRKMSVYVKGEKKKARVVQIREDVDVESRIKDLSRIYDTDFPEDLPDSQVAAIAVDALNTIRTGQGDEPIRYRTMVYKLTDLGSDVKVDMPTEFVETSLAVLQNRGRAADQAAGAALAVALRAPAPDDPAAAAPPADPAAPPAG